MTAYAQIGMLHRNPHYLDRRIGLDLLSALFRDVDQALHDLDAPSATKRRGMRRRGILPLYMRPCRPFPPA